MAARTEWVGVETRVSDQISWRLDPSGLVRGRDSALPRRLQKWRVVGDSRTAKQQIRDHVTTCSSVSTEYQTSLRLDEGARNITVATSLPPEEFGSSRSPVLTVEEGVYLEDRGLSSSVTHSMVEEEETMVAESPADGEAPSSGSKSTNGYGYRSGQEEESENEELEEDSVELTIKEAHSFKIFQPHDEGKREPVSILDLDYDIKKSQVGSAKLHIEGYRCSDSSEGFRQTIDSWSIKPDGEKLGVYVRETKGSWIMLQKPFKEYDISVRGARLIAKFLELAMTSKETDTKKCLVRLEKSWSRDDIKTVLLKYYPSVVMKVVQSTHGQNLARMSPIIENMESLLKGKSRNEKPVATVKRPSSNDETKPEILTSGVDSLGNKRRRTEELDPESFSKKTVQKEKKHTASTILASNKRRRVVESDFEDDSCSEDHVPLAQREFQLSERSQINNSVPRDELVESIVKRNDNECRKHHLNSGASSGLRRSPGFNKHDASPRWDDIGTDHEGEQEYQDIADAYGGQNDGLGEIIDDDDEELGDSAFCAICDDGGDLLLCDGRCMRSFHASHESAANSESHCTSLGYDPEDVREMGSWKCPNCVYGQHQCFICGNLGRSEGDDKEVYLCDVALCGRFYHPVCLAKWKIDEKANSITDEDAFIRDVKAGIKEFCCPAHKCRRCGEGEEDGGVDNSMKLAKCRRCPKAYHKICLPKTISFDEKPIRAWEIGDEDDPMKRLVIYCLRHKIVEKLSTPSRDHLKWPKVSSPENIRRKDSLKGMGYSAQITRKQKFPKNSSTTKQILVKHEEEDEVIHGTYLKGVEVSSRRKVLDGDLVLGEQHALAKSDTDLDFPATGGRDRSSHMPKKDAPVLAPTPLAPSPKHVMLPRKIDPQKRKTVSSIFPTATEGREERLQEVMRRASQKITLETVKEKLAQPSCYGENKKKNFLHLGELQSMLNAIKKAAEKVKNGGSFEDAKRLCPKDYFLRFLKNEDMLRVHLAPILHGMRYTSFGRHFTCIDKLKEIVDRIHPYIDSGDMIVDFCCGANDFSVILNEKLLSTGKTCQFMNFDIHPPKNDFCFTKGDWLLNPGHGFLEGKKLIMGLNPPFGVRAALANRFITHALKFKPKLLVLIVPPETMSYSKDYNDFRYDLVWEDKALLKGHAFYLPGSVDENDGENKTQWNVVPPPLYLWSSRDMIQKHRDTAVRYNHVERLNADPSVVPSRQSPTPNPSARQVPRLTIPSDKWTNSSSTPTDCDTSSSRLQHSSATSSADAYSQNSLDGSGHCLPAGHHVPVQNSFLGRQASGEQCSDQTAHQQTAFMRTGFGHDSTGHIPAPGAGPPQNNRPPVLPRHLLQNPATAASSSHSGPPHSKFQRNVTMPTSELSRHGNASLSQSASELVSNQGNVNLNQSSPRGNPPKWAHIELPLPSQYYHDPNISRNGLDSIDWQYAGPKISPRQPTPVAESHRPHNLYGVQQPWPGFTPGPNLPYNHGFQQRLPMRPLPQAPPLPPHVGHGSGPGLRQSFPPTQDLYARGPPVLPQRRPGDQHKDSGGWLE